MQFSLFFKPKKIVFVIFFFVLIFLTGCTKDVKAVALSFTEETANLIVGDTKTVTPVIVPENATDVVLEWSSSNNSIVTVNNGLITAIAPGVADITISFANLRASLRVTVSLQTYTVTFESNGGTTIANQIVNEDGQATKPSNPTKAGHIFLGWYNADLSESYSFQTPIVSNITLYAKYSVNNYLVSFNPDNGDPQTSQRINYNELIAAFTPPTKEGYTLLGWFDGEDIFNLTTPITKNTSLKAKWAPRNDIPYQVKHLVFNKVTNVFDLLDTENLTGSTGASVSATIRTIQGMMPEQEAYEAVVLGDGSLIIEVKYVEYSYNLTYELNGGNFTYPTREAMTNDFLADYNAFNNSSYTIATLPMGAWTLTNFHSFFYNASYRQKWLWLPTYLSEVGSSTNKQACRDVVRLETSSAFTSANANWIYALSYEVRGFIASRKYIENANWMSTDYSDFDIANGFWATFTSLHETTVIKNLNEPITLQSVVYRDGYLFDGWYTDASYTGNPVTEVSQKATVYAKWKVNNPVTEISISNSITSMEKYATHQLTLVIGPANAYNKKVVYKTSDETILTVSDAGLITAKNSGTATITIEAVMGDAKTTITIEVVPQNNLDVRFNDDFSGALKVDEEVELITTGFGSLANASVTFTSKQPNILSVSSTGTVKALALGVATIEVSVGGNVLVTVTINVIPPTTSERVDKLLALLIENNTAVVDSVNASLYYDNYSSFQQYYKSTYSSVNYYLFDKMNIDKTSYLVTPKSSMKASTEFITVHDTANINGGLTAHGQYWTNPSTETSIHFTVGDYGVLQNLDTRYVAYHAGDGTGVTFSYQDTGVNAQGNLNPDIDISTDGYFTFNGTKSTIVAPKNNAGQILDKSYFTYLGPNWKIGTNGNYYLGTTWFVDSQVVRGVIGSRGGNNNSTGIEMCVNTNGDIYDTWQRTAKLVASLMQEHSLGLDRVVQHNTFTGKNCPQSLLMTNYWEEFIKMVQVEYEILTKYSDATITFVSNNPTLLSNTGRVIGRPLTTTTVSYTLTVKIGADTKTITLNTLIPGLASWSQRDGFFSTR